MTQPRVSSRVTIDVERLAIGELSAVTVRRRQQQPNNRAFGQGHSGDLDLLGGHTTHPLDGASVPGHFLDEALSIVRSLADAGYQVRLLGKYTECVGHQ